MEDDPERCSYEANPHVAAADPASVTVCRSARLGASC